MKIKDLIQRYDKEVNRIPPKPKADGGTFYAIRVLITYKDHQLAVRYYQQNYLGAMSLESAKNLADFTTDGMGEESPTLFASKAEVIDTAKRVQAACNRINQRVNILQTIERQCFVKPIVWKGEESLIKHPSGQYNAKNDEYIP